MPVARKDVADKLNESALEACSVIDQVLTGKIEGINANARLGAAKLILNKIIPDLKAVEAKIDANVTMQDFIIGGPEDTSNT